MLIQREGGTEWKKKTEDKLQLLYEGKPFSFSAVLLPGEDSTDCIFAKRERRQRVEKLLSGLLLLSFCLCTPDYENEQEPVTPQLLLHIQGGAGRHTLDTNTKKKRDCVCRMTKKDNTLWQKSHPPPDNPCLYDGRKRETEEVEKSPPKLKQRHCCLNTRSNILFIFSKEEAVNTWWEW